MSRKTLPAEIPTPKTRSVRRPGSAVARWAAAPCVSRSLKAEDGGFDSPLPRAAAQLQNAQLSSKMPSATSNVRNCCPTWPADLACGRPPGGRKRSMPTSATKPLRRLRPRREGARASIATGKRAVRLTACGGNKLDSAFVAEPKQRTTTTATLRGSILSMMRTMRMESRLFPPFRPSAGHANQASQHH